MAFFIGTKKARKAMILYLGRAVVENPDLKNEFMSSRFQRM
jgi:hypothetical protein